MTDTPPESDASNPAIDDDEEEDHDYYEPPPPPPRRDDVVSGDTARMLQAALEDARRVNAAIAREREALVENLSDVQMRCTELLIENRRLRRLLIQMRDLASGPEDDDG